MTSIRIDQVMDGLKNRVELVPNLHGRVYTHVPDTMDPPCVVIVPGTFIPGDTKAAISYDSTFGRGVHDYVFTLLVVVSRTVDRVGQNHLQRLISADGPDSIKGAIEGDVSLGGVAHFVDVNRVIQYGHVTWNGNSFYGAQQVIEVTA